MVKPVLPEVRVPLHKIVFSDIFDVTEQHMCAINFALYKVAAIAPNRELYEGEFYQKTSDMRYYVHELDEQNETVGGW